MTENKIQNLVKDIFDKNTYSAAESNQIFNQIELFSNALQAELNKEKISADIFHGGSSAKGTFIKGNFDVDLFVRFDFKKYSEFSSKLSDILHLPIERVTNNKFDRLHGSRDYFQYKLKWKFPINFEIVPVLKIDNPKDAKNVTDCSPLHVIWLKSKLTKNKNLLKESIATKLFFKSAKIYGAESYINGFSGHVVDILMVHYGSFENLIKDCTKWENHHVIDVENHYLNKEHVLKDLDESKISSLIVIDPVQSDRNAAAALSKKNIDLLKSRSKLFLAKPQLSFFKPPSFSLKKLKDEEVPHCKKIILRVAPLKTKKDIAGSKILKLYNKIISRLKRADFDVFDSGWVWLSSNAYMWFYITNNSISFIKNNPNIIREGPPKTKKIDVGRFKSKHKSFFWHDDKIYAKVERQDADYNKIIHNTIKEEKEKNNIRNAEVII